MEMRDENKTSGQLLADKWSWATAELQEDGEKYRVLVEKAGEAILVAQDGMLKFANPKASEYTGYSEAELTTRSLVEFVHPDDREMITTCHMSRLKGEKFPNIYPFRIVDKGGSTKWVELNTALIKWEGRPATLNFLTDITDRKQVEEELRETNALLESILESSSSVSIVSADWEHNIVYWNAGAERIFGYKAEEMVGSCKIDILYPDDEETEEKLTQIRSDIFSSKKGRNCEIRELTKDGEEVWINLNVAPRLDERGQVIGTLGIGEDITHRKQAEAALERERTMLVQRVEERTAELKTTNMELARANRLKDEFLANMSHELRTPLSAILGMSEVLQKGIYGTLEQKQSQCLQRIEEGGRHLLDLINDVLDIAKVGAGKLGLEIRPVSVESVCQASLRLINQQARKKRLEVSLELDSAAPVIQVDERRLKEILVNLLSNAVKFTPEGGAIGLEVALDPGRQMVDLTVWDTGIGISKEDIELLFQPFVQLDGGLSRQHPGTGLGLALVHKMTEMHGGNISVESEIGKGSRFTVSLPWQETVKSEEAALEAESAQSSAQIQERAVTAFSEMLKGKQPLILLADDDEVCVSFVLELLLFNGCHVIVARNGQEAIQQAKKQRPDVILMDIQMPETNGLEAIRSIRADADTSDIRIVALTGLAMRGDRERCLDAGADDYITKPFNLAELTEAIGGQLCQKANA